MKNFQELQDKISQWKKESLPGVTIEGSVRHLIEEAQDLETNPYDPLSLADCFILLMGICGEAGFSMEEMYQAVLSKMAINESRKNWIIDEKTGIIRHKK